MQFRGRHQFELVGAPPPDSMPAPSGRLLARIKSKFKRLWYGPSVHLSSAFETRFLKLTARQVFQLAVDTLIWKGAKGDLKEIKTILATDEPQAPQRLTAKLQQAL